MRMRFRLAQLPLLGLSVLFLGAANCNKRPNCSLYQNDKAGCESQTYGRWTGCLFGQAGGESACVPNYAYCADLNNDDKLKANPALLEATCNADKNDPSMAGRHASFSYDCSYDQASKSCIGDCRIPRANCFRATLNLDGTCGEAETLERLLCEKGVARHGPNKGKPGCVRKQTNALVALQASCDPGQASKELCSAQKITIPGTSAKTAACIWGKDPAWRRHGGWRKHR